MEGSLVLPYASYTACEVSLTTLGDASAGANYAGYTNQLTQDEADQTYPFNGRDCPKSHYGDYDAVRAALWHVLMRGGDSSGHKIKDDDNGDNGDEDEDDDDGYATFFDPRLWDQRADGSAARSQRVSFPDFMVRNRELVLCGRLSLEHLLSSDGSERYFQSRIENRIPSSNVSTLLVFRRRRRKHERDSETFKPIGERYVHGVIEGR